MTEILQQLRLLLSVLSHFQRMCKRVVNSVAELRETDRLKHEK